MGNDDAHIYGDVDELNHDNDDLDNVHGDDLDPGDCDAFVVEPEEKS